MSRLPSYSLTQGKRPFWHASVALLLYSLVILASAAPGAGAEHPFNPYLIPKIDRYAVAAPKGEGLLAVNKGADCGFGSSDPHDQFWPPASAAPPLTPIATASPKYALVLPFSRNYRYLLKPSRAPPLA